MNFYKGDKVSLLLKDSRKVEGIVLAAAGEKEQQKILVKTKENEILLKSFQIKEVLKVGF